MYVNYEKYGFTHISSIYTDRRKNKVMRNQVNIQMPMLTKHVTNLNMIAFQIKSAYLMEIIMRSKKH